jgi:hypothetical protein
LSTVALALVAALALGAAPVLSQAVEGSSGRLAGGVTDGSGEPLPGVTVTVTSPNLMGERTAITDAEGTFGFPTVPAGTYTVRTQLEGFVPQERTEVEVRLGRTTEIRFEMALGAVSETVVVTADTPVLDPEQVSVSQNFNEEYLQKASVSSLNRGYQNVLGQAAGVTAINGSSSNPSVFGSTFGENAYYIDGIDSTDPVTATFGINLNFDTIQEINFETGGFEAQYGRATGGVVNVITKSGGNEFSGTFDLRYRDNDFNTSGEHFDADADDSSFLDPAATLGGPIARDRAWFFAAAEDVESKATPSASPTTRIFEGTNLMGKVTWQATQSWSLVGRWLEEDAQIDNANADPLVAAEATRVQEQPAAISSLELFGTPTDSLALSFKAALVRNELNSFPQSGDLTTLGHSDEFGDLSRSVNYTNIQLSDRDRDELNGSLTWFVDDLAGDHELKTGIEYADLFFRSRNDIVGDFYYGDAFGDPFVFWHSPSTGFAEFDGEINGLYVQDTWRVDPRITLKLGARYDQVAFRNDTGAEIADMDELQPRIGVAWDIGGESKTVARLSWGRFMHPNALTLPSFARQDNAPTFAYLSCSANGLDRELCEAIFSGELTAGGFTVPTWILDPQNHDPAGWVLVPGNVFSSLPSTIAEGLEPTFADELVVGVERQLTRRTALGLSYIDKTTEDIFEDTCDGNVVTPSADASCDFYVMVNLPGLRRDYEGLLLTFESRATDWLHVLASYTYSESKGNVEYTQNAGADFDVFPDHFDNRYGFLEDHQRHRVKFNGYVDLPLDFTVGFDAFWSSAFRYEAREASPVYDEIFTEPRGSREASDLYRLDLQVAKGFEIGKVRLQAIAAVLNVLDDEQTLQVCNRVEGCGDDALDQGLLFRQPRSFEAGFRLEF